MKKLSTCYVLLLSILFSGTALGQYSTTLPAVELPSIMESFIHNAPDSLYNRLKVDLKVQIKRHDDGSLSDGIQTGNVSNPSYTKVLKAGKSAPVNRNDFRRDPTTSNKRVDLIITVPKMNIGDLDDVNEEGVIWNLGLDHEPTYTIVKSIAETGELQIIAVYKDGVPKETGEPLIHLQGHVCHPDDIDPRCW